MYTQHLKWLKSHYNNQIKLAKSTVNYDTDYGTYNNIRLAEFQPMRRHKCFRKHWCTLCFLATIVRHDWRENWRRIVLSEARGWHNPPRSLTATEKFHYGKIQLILFLTWPGIETKTKGGILPQQKALF